LGFEIELTLQARRMLEEISDRRIQRIVGERISVLAEEPENQGRALLGELAGYRSVRAAGQRYRIIYKVRQDRVVVVVVAVGIRKEGDKRDIYRLMGRLINLGLVEQPP
jgi:mRNA interferase RelE/StbE